MDAEQQKPAEINKRLRKLYKKQKGETDKESKKAIMAEILHLRSMAAKTANRINIYDCQLLKPEATKVPGNVVARERTVAKAAQREKGDDALKKYKGMVAESRKVASDRIKATAIRGIGYVQNN